MWLSFFADNLNTPERIQTRCSGGVVSLEDNIRLLSCFPLCDTPGARFNLLALLSTGVQLYVSLNLFSFFIK